MTGPGGTEADRAARERLAREARETATALLDWVGTRVDGAATSRADGASGRPRQSPGPCTWCPVCALVAALRGEQPELTATLAEQASGLLLMLRLLVQAHASGAHEHGGHEPHEHPAPEAWPTPAPAAAAPSAEEPTPPVPWDIAPHALFDPDPGPAPVDHEPARPAPERPTGKRGPRPSPRRPTAGADPATEPDDVIASVPAAAAEPRPFPQPAPEPPPAPSSPSPSSPGPSSPAPASVTATTDRSGRVQRIPVRRRTRSC